MNKQAYICCMAVSLMVTFFNLQAAAASSSTSGSRFKTSTALTRYKDVQAFVHAECTAPAERAQSAPIHYSDLLDLNQLPARGLPSGERNLVYLFDTLCGVMPLFADGDNWEKKIACGALCAGATDFIAYILLKKKELEQHQLIVDAKKAYIQQKLDDGLAIKDKQSWDSFKQGYFAVDSASSLRSDHIMYQQEAEVLFAVYKAQDTVKVLPQNSTDGEQLNTRKANVSGIDTGSLHTIPYRFRPSKTVWALLGIGTVGLLSSLFKMDVSSSAQVISDEVAKQVLS